MIDETEQSVTLTPREIDEELKTPLPRGAGAEIPQQKTRPGQTPLEYTEQAFNELVAANTAMTGEISNLNGQIEYLNKTYQARIDELTNHVETLQAAAKSVSETVRDQRKALEEQKTDVGTARNAADYERERANAIQRKLDRSSGYLDRVLDEQQTYRDRDGAPVMPGEIGPDLGAIDMPWRGPGNNFEGTVATLRSSEYPRRRY